MAIQSESVSAGANLKATAILNFDHVEVKTVYEPIAPRGSADRSWLQTAHARFVKTLRPVYSVNERQPVSVTLHKGRGSCSQRMARLEAVSRAAGIPTRVRALYVKGSFWYPRFKFLRLFIPNRLLLLWPQFFLEGKWVDFDELHAPIEELASKGSQGFTNDAESLFEAVRDTPVDFMGKTCGLACGRPDYDLSRFVLADEGIFDSRDDALERLGSFQDSLRGRAFEVLFGSRSV